MRRGQGACGGTDKTADICQLCGGLFLATRPPPAHRTSIGTRRPNPPRTRIAYRTQTPLHTYRHTFSTDKMPNDPIMETHLRQIIFSWLYLRARACSEGSMIPPRRRSTRWRVDSAGKATSTMARADGVSTPRLGNKRCCIGSRLATKRRAPRLWASSCQ